MYGLDLFSGIGGITKALEGYVEPVAYCENERYAQAVLLSRMSTGDIPIAPIWDDVTTLRGTMLPPVEIIYGGFPCQDISTAGLGKGLDGKRSGLFFEVARIVSEIRPRFVFLENVSAITTRGAERVIGELCRMGYDSRWGVISAGNKLHRRNRWFCLSHTNSTHGERRELSSRTHKKLDDNGSSSWWETEPNVDRVANGIPFRVERLIALGNAVVPAQAREAFERLMGLK